jgi:5'-nucleotidase
MNTPNLTNAVSIEGVTFLDEADSINRYVPEIQGQGVHAIVVLLHEGGSQPPYDGPTRAGGNVTGRVAGIIPRLDSDVDVVLSGHTHKFTNAFLANAGGKPVLVTQAYMYGTGYADVDLTIDRATDEIVEKSARIVPAYADAGPGTSPDPATAAFLAADEHVLAPVENRIIGIAGEDITREENSAGESALGDMVADSDRASLKADVGFGTSGSLRADLAGGTISWGSLYAVQPFGDTILSETLTGEQVRQALERQWQEPLPPHNLIVSGIEYHYDPAQPAGSRVTEVMVHGAPLDRTTDYMVALDSYLASGGDGYTSLVGGRNITYGPSDVDALVSYVGSLPQPVNETIDGRIRRIN